MTARGHSCIVLFFVLAATLGGCAAPPPPRAPGFGGDAPAAEDDHDEDAAPLPATPSPVLVLQGAPTQPSEAIGLIDVHSKSADQPFALERLKQRAERLGADAVIDVEFHHGEPGGEPSHLSGTAVRFRDLLQGRPYDTIGELRATADMGDEASALRHLREQARAAGASLVIGVEFVHGEGNDRTEVHGTAVRFR